MTILTPIYFATLGLRTDFAASFDAAIVLLIFFVACAGRIIGAGLGVMVAGMKQRKALAVGFGLNARDAMEIALASAAMHYRLITEQIFVALVIIFSKHWIVFIQVSIKGQKIAQFISPNDADILIHAVFSPSFYPLIFRCIFHCAFQCLM